MGLTGRPVLMRAFQRGRRCTGFVGEGAVFDLTPAVDSPGAPQERARLSPALRRWGTDGLKRGAPERAGAALRGWASRRLFTRTIWRVLLSDATTFARFCRRMLLREASGINYPGELPRGMSGSFVAMRFATSHSAFHASVHGGIWRLSAGGSPGV